RSRFISKRPRAVRRRSRRRAVPLRSRAATGRRDERLRQGGSIPDLGMALPDQQHWLHARVAAVSLRAELSWLSRPGAAQSDRSLPSEEKLELLDFRVGVGASEFPQSRTLRTRKQQGSRMVRTARGHVHAEQRRPSLY